MLPAGKRVYIAGCGGMLGRAVYAEFARDCVVKATDIDLNIHWLEHADVRDLAGFDASVTAFTPDILINLSALTDLEYCERNAENSWLTNALGAENAATHRATTGYPARPDQHGRHRRRRARRLQRFRASESARYLCEVEVLRRGRCPAPLPEILRVSSRLDDGRRTCEGQKFVNKIFKQIAAGATELKVVGDKLGTPTYTVSFARGIRIVAGTDLYGVYNQVCEGDCSRYDVAVEFVRLLGLENRVKVTQVDSDYFKQEYFAPRPASEKLVNMKLHARGFRHMPHWREALAEYAEEFKAALPRR